jgi:hypothetical protein
LAATAAASDPVSPWLLNIAGRGFRADRQCIGFVSTPRHLRQLLLDRVDAVAFLPRLGVPGSR